jgi:hypothetical protein
MKTFLGLVAVAAAGVWLWARPGFLSSSAQPGPRGALVIGGVDASGSTRDGLLAQGAIYSKKIAARLDPTRDFLSVYRVDRQAHEVTSGPAPTSARRFSLHLIREVSEEAVQGGTYPALFWEAAAREAGASVRPVVIYFFTDGDNDDQSARGKARLRAATTRLTRNPRVRAIYLFGSKRSNREALRLAFPGRPPEQVVVQGAGEIDIAPLVTRIEELRRREERPYEESEPAP